MHRHDPPRSRRTSPFRPLGLAVFAVSLWIAGCGSEPRPAEDPPGVVPAADVRSTGLDSALVSGAFRQAATLPRLHSLLVARHGVLAGERYFRGPGRDRPANIKSASKSVISALIGIAVAEGHLEGVDQPVAPFFAGYLEPGADPRKQRITVGHLLSMQSGLESTSGRGYGAWVASDNWAAYAFRRPMVAEPGGPMIYSTGNTHLLSALLTKATGTSTLAYARSRLGEPLGIEIPAWTRDPQGIYFGGNEMALTPRAMLRFGELYRNGGRAGGRQVLPEAWIRASWEPRTRSPWSGEQYGYGWFVSRAGNHPMYFAWGYGGQYIFVLPGLEMTVVVTSDADVPSRSDGHRQAIFDLLTRWLVPAAEQGA